MMKPQPTHHVILVFAVYGPLKQSLLTPRSCQCVALYENSLLLGNSVYLRLDLVNVLLCMRIVYYLETQFTFV